MSRVIIILDWEGISFSLLEQPSFPNTSGAVTEQGCTANLRMAISPFQKRHTAAHRSNHLHVSGAFQRRSSSHILQNPSLWHLNPHSTAWNPSQVKLTLTALEGLAHFLDFLKVLIFKGNNMLEKIQLKTKSKQPYTPQHTAYSANMDLESLSTKTDQQTWSCTIWLCWRVACEKQAIKISNLLPW